MVSLRLVTWLCFAFFSLTGLSLQQKADLRLEVMPRYIQFRSRPTVTLTCTLTDGAGGWVSLSGCGFREYYSGAAWDVETGSATINNTIEGRETSGLITSNPEDGPGLCSLKIAGLPGRTTYILGCRVRPVSSEGWRYASMMVHVDKYSHQQYRLQPPGVLVSRPGSDVSITGLAEHRVGACAFYLPPDNTGIGLDSGTSENTTRYRAWTTGRRCGVTLLSVQPSSSGFVWSWVWSFSPDRRSANFVELLVATAPESPPLLTLDSEHFEAGDMLLATCVVKNSRPVATITWLLNGDVIRKDRKNEAPAESSWRWNHEPQTILQRLSRRLRIEDDGKVLKCQAGHLALPGGFQNSNKYTIRFKDACSPSPCGPHSDCRVHSSFASCSCKPPYIGKPPSCRPECFNSSGCPLDKACVNQTCQDPCPRTGCGQDAVCQVVSHVPTCRCPVNFRGDPNSLCKPKLACGVNVVTTSLVAGGRATDRGAWPWLAAIFENVENSFFCGGSLISNKHVLTAAHCIKQREVNKTYEKDQIVVVLGKYQQSDQFERYTQPRNVEKLHIHDLYDTLHPSRFDIALLVLDDPVVFSHVVQPICLFTSGFALHLTHQSATVVGWGETENETMTNVPREGGVRIVSLEECHAGFALRTLFTNEYTLCGGYKNGTGPCAGDSGGPLMVRVIASDGVARWYLRGIVSSALGSDSCRNTDFAIYTDVVKLYSSWLKPLLTG